MYLTSWIEGIKPVKIVNTKLHAVPLLIRILIIAIIITYADARCTKF